jgi:hypothetical protein
MNTLVVLVVCLKVASGECDPRTVKHLEYAFSEDLTLPHNCAQVVQVKAAEYLARYPELSLVRGTCKPHKTEYAI